MDQKRSYLSARPYSGSPDPADRLIGALHSLFTASLDHKATFDAFSAKRLKTAYFFHGRDVIEASCQQVPQEEFHFSDARYFTAFSKSYELDSYDPAIRDFMDQQPRPVKNSLMFVLMLAKKTLQIEPDEKETQLFREHMEVLCNHFDLTDPRLSDTEATFQRYKSVAGNERILDRQKAAERQIEILCSADITLKKRAEAASHAKGDIDALLKMKERISGVEKALVIAAENSQRTAKTYLYSHVMSPLGEKGTEEFRQSLFEALVAADSKEQNRIFCQMINEQCGIPTGLTQTIARAFSGEEEDEAIKQAKAVKKDARDITENFDRLYRQDWTAASLAKCRAQIDLIDDIVASTTQLCCNYLEDKAGKVDYLPEFKNEIIKEIQTLCLHGKVTRPELTLYYHMLPVDPPRTRFDSINRADLVAMDLRLAERSEAISRPAGIKPVEVSQTTLNLLAKEDFVLEYLADQSRPYRENILAAHKKLSGTGAHFGAKNDLIFPPKPEL